MAKQRSKLSLLSKLEVPSELACFVWCCAAEHCFTDASYYRTHTMTWFAGATMQSQIRLTQQMRCCQTSGISHITGSWQHTQQLGAAKPSSGPPHLVLTMYMETSTWCPGYLKQHQLLQLQLGNRRQLQLLRIFAQFQKNQEKKLI